MVSKYEVVTLCGSTKFKDDFIKAQEALTLLGCIVISVGLFGHADNKYNTKISPEIKTMLDDMHKRKIDMADSILVINRDDYIGESTASEIAYAKATGKKVSYMFEHNECEHEWEFAGASYTDFDTIHHYECSKCGAKKSTSIGI